MVEEVMVVALTAWGKVKEKERKPVDYVPKVAKPKVRVMSGRLPTQRSNNRPKGFKEYRPRPKPSREESFLRSVSWDVHNYEEQDAWQR